MNPYRDQCTPSGREIMAVLEASTCHITAEDSRILAKQSASDEYSHWVYAWIKRDEHDRLSDSFWNTLMVAQKEGCRYVRFDRDGPQYEDLPHNDW